MTLSDFKMLIIEDTTRMHDEKGGKCHKLGVMVAIAEEKIIWEGTFRWLTSNKCSTLWPIPNSWFVCGSCTSRLQLEKWRSRLSLQNWLIERRLKDSVARNKVKYFPMDNLDEEIDLMLPTSMEDPFKGVNGSRMS